MLLLVLELVTILALAVYDRMVIRPREAKANGI